LNEDIFSPDAVRIAMDGAYFHDLLRDAPIFNLYDYTIHYYARYPAVSLGFREPFFQFILGILYHIFGISMSVAKLGVLIFAAIGIIFFYKLVENIYGRIAAILSSLLFITAPFLVRFTWIPMLEMPALAMSLATIYYFYRYVELKDKKALGLFFVIFALSLWTKRLTWFIFIFCALYLTVAGGWRLFVKKEALRWLALFMLMITPLIVISAWLGEPTIKRAAPLAKVAVTADAVKSQAAIRTVALPKGFVMRVPDFIYYLKALYKFNLTLPVVALSLAGAILAIFKRDRRAILFACWIIAVYITMISIR
jgi:4-amino-4-deoxy-L-arabinose transferase-like glycosyltransferase